MIVSIDWLKEFVDIKEPPDKLADMLSSIGLEAEFLNSFEGLDGVVIGKVKSIEKHPNADRLSVCTVYDGKQDYQVVCGAKNVAKDQTIAYAKVGSVLPGGFRLEKIKLRGVESSGMICSAKELNIHDDHEGIIVLPESCKVGKDFLEEYGNKFLKIELLKPTKIYVKEILNLIKYNLINGCANITGGGLADNIKRVIPEGLSAEINLNKIKTKKIFSWLKENNINDKEMLRTFNCGVGFCIIINPKNFKKIKSFFTKEYEPYIIGKIASGKNKIKLNEKINWS